MPHQATARRIERSPLGAGVDRARLLSPKGEPHLVARMQDLNGQNYCPASPSPDFLSEVLQDLRLARASYGRSELTAPWGIEIPFKEGVRFHFVAEGTVRLSGKNLRF